MLAVHDIVPAVDQYEGVVLAPLHGPYLLNGDEAGQVLDLRVAVALVLHAREPEQLAVTHFLPETLLDDLLLPPQLLVVLEEVQVRQHPHDVRETYLLNRFLIS